MENAVLLGCFIVIALLGFFCMKKIDVFLYNMQKETEQRQQTYSLRVAISDLYPAYSVSNTLAEMQERYPDLRYTLSVGQDDELLQYFDENNTDVIIVSPDIDSSKYPCKCASFESCPLKLNECSITLVPISAEKQQRKIFWQNCKSHPLVPEFVNLLCQTSV